MYWKLLAPLFALALAIGWFFPESGTAPLPEASGESSHFVIDAKRGKKAENLGSGSYDAVELQRQPDGHFYAEADVDGNTVRFLVDTGASMIALSARDAEAMGLEWNDSELQHVGRGVNGDVFGKPVTLANVVVGDLQADDVAAVIIPEGLDVSLLGQSFLSRVEAVNIEGDRMTLN
jgi:aspartyl protease family protein